MKQVLAQIEHLNIRYGAVNAVRDVSFALYEGEVLALIGPNGSGKTSTVECLEGLRRPTGGTIEFLGYDPHKNRCQLYNQIGIQLQEVEYPDMMRVRELCRLFSSFYENPVDWEQLLNKLGLSKKSNRMVRKLSGGEKQRLSILLALLPRPKVLILDELTTGLDPEVRRGMWESLRHIRQTGTTILLISHYMDEVEYLADRLVYLESGKSVFVGTPQEFRLYAKNHVPRGQWRENLSLEDVYLMLTPKTNLFELEDLL